MQALKDLRAPADFAAKREISRDRIDHQTRSVVRKKAGAAEAGQGPAGLGNLAAEAAEGAAKPAEAKS